MANPHHTEQDALLISKCIDALGQNEFYDRMLDLLGHDIRHDLAALVRYSRSAKPDLIIPRIELTDIIMSYYHHFFALDPFFIHWRNGGETGVFRLRGMVSGLGRSHYARDFLSPMSIHDEIAVFLPPIGDACPTLILDRKDGIFTEAEMRRVKSLFPVFAALHRRHLSIFVSAGLDLSESPIGHERPLRLLDQNGLQVFATRAWADQLARHKDDLQNAVAALASAGPSMVQLPNGTALRRTRLPFDFGPAPGGYCDELTAGDVVEFRNRPSSHRLPPSLEVQLTAREQDVVLLTLEGYPTVEIARKLKLSKGTIKNYRLNIYRKLDITTERELFGAYIRGLGERPNAS